MVQKFYAIKDEQAIKKGTLISTLFALVVSGGCYFLGGFSRLYPEAFASGSYDAIIPAMVSELSPFLIGLVIILVLSASMSTLSSLAMASSASLTIDLISPAARSKNKPLTDGQEVFIMRVLIVVFVVISAVIAIVQYYGNFSFIAQMMGVSWGALAGAFLAPFLYGLYWKKTTKASVWFSFCFGVGVMVLYLIYDLALSSYFTLPAFLDSSLTLGSLVILLNLALVPLISLFTKKPDADKVDEIFSCYDRTITVHMTTALDEAEKKK